MTLVVTKCGSFKEFFGNEPVCAPPRHDELLRRGRYYRPIGPGMLKEFSCAEGAFYLPPRRTIIVQWEWKACCDNQGNPAVEGLMVTLNRFSGKPIAAVRRTVDQNGSSVQYAGDEGFIVGVLMTKRDDLEQLIS